MWKQLDLLNDFAEGINWTCSMFLKCLGSNKSLCKSNVVIIFNCFISEIFSYIFLSRIIQRYPNEGFFVIVYSDTTDYINELGFGFLTHMCACESLMCFIMLN